MSRGKWTIESRPRYSVYNKKTDLPVMISGTADECAKAMGVAMSSFYSTYSRLKNGRAMSKTWEIFQDEEDLDEEVDLCQK